MKRVWRFVFVVALAGGLARSPEAGASATGVLEIIEAVVRNQAIRNAEHVTTAFLAEREQSRLGDSSDVLSTEPSVADKLVIKRRGALEAMYDAIDVPRDERELRWELKKIAKAFQEKLHTHTMLSATAKLARNVDREYLESLRKSQLQVLRELDRALLLASKSSFMLSKLDSKLRARKWLYQGALTGLTIGVPAGLSVLFPFHHWYYGLPEALTIAMTGTPAANWLFQKKANQQIVSALESGTARAIELFFSELESLGQVIPSRFSAEDRSDSFGMIKRFLSFWIWTPPLCEVLLAKPVSQGGSPKPNARFRVESTDSGAALEERELRDRELQEQEAQDRFEERGKQVR